MRYALSTREDAAGAVFGGVPLPGERAGREGVRIVRRPSVQTQRRAVLRTHPAGHRNFHPQTSVSRGRGTTPFAIQLLPPLALFLTLVFQLWIRVGLIETSYHMESLRQKAVNKDAEVRKLRSDFAVITSPRALAGRARLELGMILPSGKSIRKFEK